MTVGAGRPPGHEVFTSSSAASVRAHEVAGIFQEAVSRRYDPRSQAGGLDDYRGSHTADGVAVTGAAGPAAEVASLDGIGQAELVRRGEVSAAELVRWAIERIERLNPALNAVVTPMFDDAIARMAQGVSGPFAGVPYLLKDLVVESSGTLFGATRNPWDVSRSTSGSSGGSAAAVASGMVAMAHGNDLGGSLRYPASACGLFGLKPTRARNPLGPEYGDAVSGGAAEHALTRSVRDSAALLDATAGPALGDPYWAPPAAGRFSDEVGADPGRLRIAFTSRTADGSPGHPDCVAALDDAVALCESLGHHIVDAQLPEITPEVGAAIGTGFNAATGWILA